SYLFSSLNVLQLVGWTAVMIASGSNALNSIIPFSSPSIWHLVIGGLILLWVLIGLKTLNRLNSIAMIGLFILTIILSFVIFKDGSSVFIGGKMSFGSAIELSVAMPLSWLPLISDYTRNAENGSKSTFVSVAVYFVISSWMYVIGMGAALFTGETDVAKIMLQAGLGIAGILIILFSTVTTTYLDVYSAGVSSSSISEKLREKPMAVIVTIIGTIIAIFVPIAKFESFLYFISSVFAPMIAILISDYFILKKDASSKSFNLVNLCIWLIGFIAYRKFMGIDTFFGSTLPVMFVVAFLCVIVNKISGGTKNA
ncbi:MAG: putative hydroxymethylpyrimidine transporter CytX, partial [Filifactoraceae bacterium]